MESHSQSSPLAPSFLPAHVTPTHILDSSTHFMDSSTHGDPTIFRSNAHDTATVLPTPNDTTLRCSSRLHKTPSHLSQYYCNTTWCNLVLPPNQFNCLICLGTVIKDSVGSIKMGK